MIEYNGHELAAIYNNSGGDIKHVCDVSNLDENTVRQRIYRAGYELEKVYRLKMPDQMRELRERAFKAPIRKKK